jgi:O-antigen/teichoic acid export membrane protein
LKAAGNISFNLVGTALPLLAGLLVFPVLLEKMGAERFGVLALIWVIVGYFGFFDLGLGRAITFSYAKELDKQPADRSYDSLKSGLTGLFLLGFIGFVVMLLLASVITGFGKFTNPALVPEATSAFRIISFCIPFVLLTNGGIAVLEAESRFAEINFCRAPMGGLLYIAPLLAYTFNPNLMSVAISLLIVRSVFCAIFLVLALSRLWGKLKTSKSSSTEAITLLSYGRWIALSYVIGPAMLYGDRFVVAGTVSVGAAGIYVIIAEVLTKILILAGAIVSVYFPKLSAMGINHPEAAVVHKNALLANLIAMLPPIFVAVIFGEQLMTYWFGRSFPPESILTIYIFAAGVLFNSFGLVFQSFIQAAGRPDITAKLHVAEFVMYITYLIVLANLFGVVGAALAWTIRTLISGMALALLFQWLSKSRAP